MYRYLYTSTCSNANARKITIVHNNNLSQATSYHGYLCNNDVMNICDGKLLVCS